jgi:reductive dehalogenase
MAVEMDRTFIGSSPDAAAGAATGAAYSKMAYTSFLLAQFIRGLGYAAVPCGNDTALSIPLAIRAGLGEAGRNGLLITREFGPRVRLFKVFTDLKIPPDPPAAFGVVAFCGVCRLCVSGCPAKAVGDADKSETGPDPLSSFGGKRRWFIHPERCFNFWRRSGSDCSNCIRTCPFSYLEGAERKVKLFLIRSFPILNPLLARLEKRGGKYRRKPLSG